VCGDDRDSLSLLSSCLVVVVVVYLVDFSLARNRGPKILVRSCCTAPPSKDHGNLFFFSTTSRAVTRSVRAFRVDP
jgi:hypothetical protein